jgi:hypothetical protein
MENHTIIGGAIELITVAMIGVGLFMSGYSFAMRNRALECIKCEDSHMKQYKEIVERKRRHEQFHKN